MAAHWHTTFFNFNSTGMKLEPVLLGVLSSRYMAEDFQSHFYALDAVPCKLPLSTTACRKAHAEGLTFIAEKCNHHYAAIVDDGRDLKLCIEFGTSSAPKMTGKRPLQQARLAMQV